MSEIDRNDALAGTGAAAATAAPPAKEVSPEERKQRHRERVRLAIAMGNAPPHESDEPAADLSTAETTDLILWLLDKVSGWNGAAAHLARPDQREALRLRLTRARRNEDHRAIEGAESARLDELTRPSRPH